MSAIRPGDYKLLAWDSITPGGIYECGDSLATTWRRNIPSLLPANIRVPDKSDGVISTSR
jgi:hypothetical protein